jgi:putative transposase
MIIATSQLHLSDILRDFKKFTAKVIIDVITRTNESRKGWVLKIFSEATYHLRRNKNYKVWQDGNHPELLMTADFQTQKLDYLHTNPVEAELVDEPEYYWYSSARDYAGKTGLLKVELLN